MTRPTINTTCAMPPTLLKKRPEHSRSVSRIASTAANANSAAASETTKWMTISITPASRPIERLPTISGGCTRVGIAIAASAKPAGEQRNRLQLGADDDAVPDRQVPQDRRIARVEPQPVPRGHRDQRHHDHRAGHEQQPVVHRQERRPPRRLQGHEQELQRHHDGDEHRARQQSAEDQRQDPVPIRVRRDEVVLEKPLHEVPREQPFTHGRPPRPRSPGRSARDWSRAPAGRRPARATRAPSACAADRPCPRRRCGRGAGR